MKVNWSYIKLVFLLLLLLGVYAFAGVRHQSKKIEKTTVEFLGEDNLFITQQMVNKLLIQNLGSLTNVPKDALVLNKVEKVLEANKMVKSAQVYLTVNGELTSKIVQRKPIGRIQGNSNFYLDDEGKRMPLSNNHSARVPIITGKITDDSLQNCFAFLNFVNADDFLKKNIIGIHIAKDNDFQLKLRLEDYVVSLGKVENLKAKFNNYKAFYSKATKDKALNNYKAVSLEYNNQVVCTKI
ncbi:MULTISPECIES: cell division protein FtsQ/DivIB [unclassified Cellulophaga]|uniref:cell division protein FtsQ/DivIB n=1 Tax=unclassified Cellulophaga TaxID=2634405 RepID=UPI0026E2F39D|nr:MULTISPECIES: cell division protein FtsQ/DivIB [unclassified Cellulophaga]MDO6490434.1 cell division protein FtsQ/DivIB [Cellulophaga sp. 2_MG-2023]MDO6494372.1 cell division protein FtsQ/DivIB [Cellulophaga sp. 3_MG-2023]